MKAVAERHACGFEGADPAILETPRDLIEAKGKRELAKRERRVDVLAQLHAQWLKDITGKRGISDEHYRAGRLFQHDCERAELRARGSGYLAGGGGAVFALSDGRLLALESAGEASARLRTVFGYLGNEAQRFTVLVLMERYNTSMAAQMIGWNRHSGVPALRLILSVLARLYVDRTATDCV